MCSSKPKIQETKTPPAPPPPEPAPDAPTFGGDRGMERRLYLRSRGITANPRPDLSGLGNQDVGTPIRRIHIGGPEKPPPSSGPAVTQTGIYAGSGRPQATRPGNRR